MAHILIDDPDAPPEREPRQSDYSGSAGGRFLAGERGAFIVPRYISRVQNSEETLRCLRLWAAIEGERIGPGYAARGKKVAFGRLWLALKKP